MKFYRCLLILAMGISTSQLIAGNFQVDKAASDVAVDAKASPPHKFTSVVKEYTYDIEIDPETLAVSKAEFAFKFADLDSDEKGRDKKMRKWMDVAVNPEARFSLNEVFERDGQSIGRGIFFMHGVSREIEIPFSVHREGHSIVLDGSTTFDYKDWDLKIIRMLIFTVKPELTPHFHLVGSIQRESNDA